MSIEIDVMNMGRQSKTIKATLPDKLVKAVEAISLTEHQRNQVFLFIYLLIRKTTQTDDPGSYIELSQKYFRKVFNGRYNTWLQKLKASAIIEVKKSGTKETYKVNKNSKAYRICSDYFDSAWIDLDITCNIKNRKLILAGKEYSTLLITDDLDELPFNSKALLRKAIEIVDSYEMSGKMKFNNDIEVDEPLSVYNEVIDKSFRLNRSTALEQAKEFKVDFIQDGNSFYLMNKEKYLEQKKAHLLRNYFFVIYNLCSRNFYASVNNTNGRLDHNLTGLNKQLLALVKERNDLVEIDLSASQFSILSARMDDEGISGADFSKFKELIEKGELYKYIAFQNSWTIEYSKQLMMIIAFSSHRNYTKPDKKRVTNLFPTVITYIDKCKKELVSTAIDKGKSKKEAGETTKQFAIELQRLESSIFIERFYLYLKSQGYWVLPKHDSFIVKKQDSKAIITLLQEVFSDAGCKFHFKVN
jgi:hypothetical protein